MSTMTLRQIREELEVVTDACRRLENLAAQSEGHSTDVAIILRPLNEQFRKLLDAIQPYIDAQMEKVRQGKIFGPSTKWKSVHSIHRYLEIGIEALEGIQTTAAEADVKAKPVSFPMVTAILHIEGALFDLDELIEIESKRKGGGLVGPLGVVS